MPPKRQRPSPSPLPEPFTPGPRRSGRIAASKSASPEPQGVHEAAEERAGRGPGRGRGRGTTTVTGTGRTQPIKLEPLEEEEDVAIEEAEVLGEDEEEEEEEEAEDDDESIDQPVIKLESRHSSVDITSLPAAAAIASDPRPHQGAPRTQPMPAPQGQGRNNAPRRASSIALDQRRPSEHTTSASRHAPPMVGPMQTLPLLQTAAAGRALNEPRPDQVPRRRLTSTSIRRGTPEPSPPPPGPPGALLGGDKRLPEWMRNFHHSFWQRVQYGLTFPVRQPLATVVSAGVTLALLLMVLCSARPICQINHPVFIWTTFIFGSPVEFVSLWCTYFLMTMGLWNAGEGLVTALRRLGQRRARHRNITVAPKVQAFFVDLELLFLQPILINILTIALRSITRLDATPAAQAVFVQFHLHLIKWIVEACCDINGKTEHIRQRLVTLTLVVFTIGSVYYHREIVGESVNHWKHLWRAADAYSRGQDERGFPTASYPTISITPGSSSMSAVYTVTTILCTGGISPSSLLQGKHT